MMASNLFALEPMSEPMAGQSEYWFAVHTVDDEATKRGLYVEWVIFADAQDVMPDRNERRQFVHLVADHLGQRPSALFQVANEPSFNGFESATDPELIELADILATRIGHRDFSIGDPQDGDNVDASEETSEQTQELAKHSNIVVLHSSRMGGAAPYGDGRVRRWIDHLEGYVDIIDACPDVHGGHDEPMGAADHQWVDVGGGKTYEREPNAAAHFAAAASAFMIGCGYCYHYISEQNDGVPGMDWIGEHLTKIPCDPSWQSFNDSWAGCPTQGFTWKGGKCRSWSNGHEAYTMVYGSEKGSISWRPGWVPMEDAVEYSVQDDHGWVHVQLWHMQMTT